MTTKNFSQMATEKAGQKMSNKEQYASVVEAKLRSLAEETGINGYDRAYINWDKMTPSERKNFCKAICEDCSDEEANHSADWLSENKYCFWTTIKDLLNY